MRVGTSVTLALVVSGSSLDKAMAVQRSVFTDCAALHLAMSGVSCGSPRSSAEQGAEGAPVLGLLASALGC